MNREVELKKGDKAKSEVITFKVDDKLLDAMKAVPNRSEFIRSAIMAALESTCPLCGGTGILTPNQKRHLSELSLNHSIEECDDCHEMHIVCKAEKRKRR